MNFTSRILSVLVLGSSIACGDDDRASVDVGPRDAMSRPDAAVDTGPSDPRCPPSPITGFACDAESVGVMCAGSVSCACSGGEFITAATPCECREGALGRVYYCEDDCVAACPSPDAGGLDAGPGDAGPLTTCSRYCQLSESAGCAPENCLAECEAAIAGMCGTEFEDFLVCTNDAPAMCSEGALFPTEGCNAEQQAIINCAS